MESAHIIWSKRHSPKSFKKSSPPLIWLALRTVESPSVLSATLVGATLISRSVVLASCKNFSLSSVDVDVSTFPSSNKYRSDVALPRVNISSPGLNISTLQRDRKASTNCCLVPINNLVRRRDGRYSFLNIFRRTDAGKNCSTGMIQHSKKKMRSVGKKRKRERYMIYVYHS